MPKGASQFFLVNPTPYHLSVQGLPSLIERQLRYIQFCGVRREKMFTASVIPNTFIISTDFEDHFPVSIVGGIVSFAVLKAITALLT